MSEKKYNLMPMVHFELIKIDLGEGVYEFLVYPKGGGIQSSEQGKLVLRMGCWTFHGWTDCFLNSEQLLEIWQIVRLLDVWPDAFNNVPVRVVQ